MSDNGISVIRPAAAADLPFLATHDHHVVPAVLDDAIRAGHILLIETAGEVVGWLRWNLFWDNTPFMNLLYLLEGHRLKGHGRALVRHWEQLLREAGFDTAMTSTQANEAAQHFYRHLGYTDVGGFSLPGDDFELLMAKTL